MNKETKQNYGVTTKNGVERYNGKPYGKWLRELGYSYLGGVTCSAKEKKSYKHGCMTYMLYLAPSDLSGYKVCPNDSECRDLCLFQSGMAKFDILAHSYQTSNIIQSRISKTRLFYSDRELFMFLLVHEIKMFKRRADRLGMDFAVRLNGTSDLSVVLFNYCGKNLLDIFSGIQFYDYTKVPSRVKLLKRFPNYDLTLSYNGLNDDECMEFLNNGGKVAVVFEGRMPKTWNGYKVNDANGYDMRFQDAPKEVCGLTYHRVATNYKDGKYQGIGDTKFVVREGDMRCTY